MVKFLIKNVRYDNYLYIFVQRVCGDWGWKDLQLLIGFWVMN